MADDGITTAGDLLHLLMEAMEHCEDDLKVALKPTDDKGDVLDHYCPGEWDNLICWPNSAPGPVKVKCPEYIVDFNHDEYVRRICDANGTWRKSLASPNKTWTNYADCMNRDLLDKEAIKKEILLGAISPRIKSMIQLYTVGYSFSLVALTFAMIILAYFQRLHCTRNYIHMHLFASFMLRAVVIFVKDHVLFIGAGIFDIQTQSETSLQDLMSRVESPPGGSTYKVGCKIVMTLFHYFVATNYYWILVEALYLHSLIFVAFFSDKKYLWRFTLTGWGVPVLFVVPWAIVRGTLEDIHCWDIAITEYKWIYNGPIVVANVINFLLFLNIIRVLWYKMRERGAINRTDNRRQYRKLAKSTLVLIPMFGVHAIVFIGMPDNVTNGIWWDIRMYFDLFFNSFQGFFVAIIYCFCNGEVQAEFKKAWERFNLSVEMQRGNRERTRSSMTMFTSFNSSMSQQARPSIGGQGNRRNSSAIKSSCQVTNTNNKSVTTSLSVNNTNNEHVMPLLYVADNNIPTTTAEYLPNLGEEELLVPQSNNGIGHPVQNSHKAPMILSIREVDVEEAMFEKALDGEFGGEGVEEVVDGVGEIDNPASKKSLMNADSGTSSGESNRTSSCETDSGTPRSKRIPSSDSGISSILGGTNLYAPASTSAKRAQITRTNPSRSASNSNSELPDTEAS